MGKNTCVCGHVRNAMLMTYGFTKLMWLLMLSLVNQIQCLEESAESLRERGLKFYKGCRKYTYVNTYMGVGKYITVIN